MTPVAPGLQISKTQTLCQSKLDAGNVRGNLPGHEFVSAARTFVIEKYSIGGMNVVCLTVISRQVIARNLRNTVGRTRVKLRLFVLRGLAHLAEHLRGRGLVEAQAVVQRAADDAYGLEHAQDAQAGDVSRELRLAE